MPSATARHRYSHFISWCFLLAAVAPVSAWGNDISLKQHCLAIGINHVAAAQSGQTEQLPLPPLEFAGKDAKGFADAIASHNKNQPTVTVLTDDDATQDINLERVTAALREACKAETETLVIYLAGHGFSYESKDYFCVSDTKLRRTSATLQIENALSISEIVEILCQSNSRNKILIMDIDRQSLGNGSSPEIQSDILKARSAEKSMLAVLSSCLPDQVSLEHEKLGHGIFTHFLVEGLRGACDYDKGNRDGEVSLQELFYYAAKHTTRYALEKCGRKQTPFIQITGTEDIVLSELSDEVNVVLDNKFRNVTFDAKSFSYEQQTALEQYSMALDSFGMLEITNCIDLLTKVLEVMPNYVEAIRLRALCYTLSGDEVKAIDDMKKLGGSQKATVFATDSSLLGIRDPKNTQTTLFELNPGDWVEIVNYSSEGRNSRGEILSAGKYLYVSRLKKRGNDEWVDAKGVIFADAIRPSTEEEVAQRIQNSQREFGSAGINSKEKILQKLKSYSKNHILITPIVQLPPPKTSFNDYQRILEILKSIESNPDRQLQPETQQPEVNQPEVNQPQALPAGAMRAKPMVKPELIDLWAVPS